VPAPGSGAFGDGEVAAGPDGDGEAEAFQQGAGALHGLGRHPQLRGDGVVRGRDVAAGAGVRDCGVRGSDAEEGVDRDVRGSPGGFAFRSADGGSDLGQPAGAVGPCRVAGVGPGGKGWGPGRGPPTIWRWPALGGRGGMRVGCGDTCLGGSWRRKKVRYDLANSNLWVRGTTKVRLPTGTSTRNRSHPDRSPNSDRDERRA